MQKLGVLIEDSDQNLKYLGLLAMGKILQTHPKAVQAHKDIVLRCLDDRDESIRLRCTKFLVYLKEKKGDCFWSLGSDSYVSRCLSNFIRLHIL